MGKPGRQAAARQHLAECWGAGLSQLLSRPAHVPSLYLSAAEAPPYAPRGALCSISGGHPCQGLFGGP